jgi:hypothetical protein
MTKLVYLLAFLGAVFLLYYFFQFLIGFAAILILSGKLG